MNNNNNNNNENHNNTLYSLICLLQQGSNLTMHYESNSYLMALLRILQCNKVHRTHPVSNGSLELMARNPSAASQRIHN